MAGDLLAMIGLKWLLMKSKKVRKFYFKSVVEYPGAGEFTLHFCSSSQQVHLISRTKR